MLYMQLNLTILFWFSFISSCEVIPRNRIHSTDLVVSIYAVRDDAIRINWKSKILKPESVSVCELVYGPVNEADQVYVLPNFVPRGYMFELKGLRYNVTYHFHMVCYSKNGTKFTSNTLQFTPGLYESTISSRPPPSHTSSSSASSSSTYFASYDPYHSSHDIVSREGAFYEEKKYLRSVRSSSVVLGAFCGIVGFLIINVTVVMAIKRYSHIQMHRQHILELEEGDFGEFVQIREYD